MIYIFLDDNSVEWEKKIDGKNRKIEKLQSNVITGHIEGEVGADHDPSSEDPNHKTIVEDSDNELICGYNNEDSDDKSIDVDCTEQLRDQDDVAHANAKNIDCKKDSDWEQSDDEPLIELKKGDY